MTNLQWSSVTQCCLIQISITTSCNYVCEPHQTRVGGQESRPSFKISFILFICIYYIKTYIFVCVWLYIEVIKQYLFAKLDGILPSNYTVLWPCHHLYSSLRSYHSKLLTALQNQLSQSCYFSQNLLELPGTVHCVNILWCLLHFPKLKTTYPN